MYHLCSGYLAPKCMLYGHLSEKADVYCFGVLLLEILSEVAPFKEWASDDSRMILALKFQFSASAHRVALN